MDSLGDKMKFYEGVNSILLRRDLPTFARIDGRAFHTFTKGMKRPFDERLYNVFRRTAIKLAVETNAKLAYAQSDEITLMWLVENPVAEMWFGGRHSKMVSQCASLTTLYFNNFLREEMPEFQKKNPSFDARVWQVPNLHEAYSVFLWRGRDAIKNGISAVAQSHFSPNELLKKSGKDKVAILENRGIFIQDFAPRYRLGSLIRKVKKLYKFTPEEIERLHPKHAAKINPDLEVERSRLEFEYVDFDAIPLGEREKFIIK